MTTIKIDKRKRDAFIKFLKEKNINQLKGITISVKSHLNLMAEEEGPPGGEGIKSIVNCSTESNNILDGTEKVNTSISESG